METTHSFQDRKTLFIVWYIGTILLFQMQMFKDNFIVAIKAWAFTNLKRFLFFKRILGAIYVHWSNAWF